VASHTSEKQQRNAPVSAAKNGMLVFFASLGTDVKKPPEGGFLLLLQRTLQNGGLYFLRIQSGRFA
jgi:hypothetical protein